MYVGMYYKVLEINDMYVGINVNVTYRTHLQPHASDLQTNIPSPF